MKTALILFAHGARDPEWANPMRQVQAELRRRCPGAAVELAFLEFMTPGLPDCAASLVTDGADKVVILPMFIARGGHLKKDVPEMLDTLRLRHPAVDFVLGGAIGEHKIVLRAMADAALEVAGSELA